MVAKQNNESSKVTVKPLRKQREFPHCLLRDAVLIEDRATVLLRTPIVGFSDNVLGQHCRSAIDSIPRTAQIARRGIRRFPPHVGSRSVNAECSQLSQGTTTLQGILILVSLLLDLGTLFSGSEADLDCRGL